ncbi:MAG: universal stress protein [Proteobacteria bacterium]|nr:universal stress protein [Pseudomonadota bacterium]MBU1387239.1 universal stress protein [Pseudomonadota bacterium]MBU1544899.1 universal stress protein [Pseudomonadota bacterium]MBU2431524.1 universal stress protein [Pseudomonadota bacterium]
MYRYKKIMVCLNLDDYDENLIQYAGILSRMARSDEVHFVHVSDTFDVPDEIKKIYPELASPLEAAAEERMRHIVEKHFNGHDRSQRIYRPLEGSLLGLLISYTKQNDIDLLISGDQSGDRAANNSLSEKLARKAFCSVMVVPRQIKPLLERILVAIDFSDHSLNALDVGSAFAKAANLDHIYILNNYQVPSRYKKTGKSYEEFDDMMLENAKAKFRASLAKVDLKSIAIKPFFQNSSNIVDGIYRFAENMNADLVVVGARGRSGDIAAILLGSITEALIRRLDRPLLAVKKKGEGLNILDAITSE